MSSVDPHPTQTPESRISVVRSLLGHRKPSEHLCTLIGMAVRGATWDEISATDQAARD